MKKTACLLVALLGLSVITINAHAQKSCCKSKFEKKVSATYCDTSAGFMVLNNGSYSKLYCRYSAIMNKQRVHGCCTWSGGILAVKEGNVICRNGTVSAVCSIQNHQKEHEERTDNTVDLNDDLW